MNAIRTGTWVKKVMADADKIGPTRIIWAGESENFKRIPGKDEYRLGEDAAYRKFN